MSSLADQLRTPQAPDARRTRAPHPKGFEPGVKYPADGTWVVTTPPIPEMLGDAEAWRQAVEAVGLTVPDGWRVRVVEMRYDPAAWHRDNQGEDAVTRPVWRYRFAVEPDPDTGQVDLDALVKRLRKRKPVSPTHGGGSTFAVSWNDWQTGKLVGGGLDGLADRLDGAFRASEERAKTLRKLGYDLGHLLIIGGGDMVEGCDIYPHQAWELDADRRTQMNATTTLICEGLDRLAPRFERVTILVVGGNHGENRIAGRRVNRGDNDDCKVFEDAARALARDPRHQHVNFVIAQDEPAKTLDVNGWIVGTTHGHVFGRGAGRSVEGKAWGWYSNQAAGKQPAGDADLLVTHHFHHLRLADWGACLWVQTPAMDGGSPQYTDWSGRDVPPGMLSWVMTDQARFAEPAVL